MNLTFKKKKYQFTGRLCNFKYDTIKNMNTHYPVIGFDTETVDDGRYGVFPFLYTFAHKEKTYMKELKYTDDFLAVFCDELLKILRELKINDCFLYVHNLMFDATQIIKKNEKLINMFKVGVVPDTGDILVLNELLYKVYIKKGGLLEGSAINFILKIQVSKKEFYHIHFRDTFSFFPTSAEKMGAACGIEKKERDDNIGLDMRVFKRSDKARWQEFVDYALTDARIHAAGGEMIIKLHNEFNLNKVRPSAAGFSMAAFYAMFPDLENPMRTGVNSHAIMQLIIDSYRGGRTGGIVHGEVSDMFVYDFKSSYPCAMRSLPSFTDHMQYIHITGKNLEQVKENFLQYCKECHLIAKVSGYESDDKYPSLLKHEKVDGAEKLVPVYGAFKDLTVTGYELYCGMASGTLVVDDVSEVVILMDDDDNCIKPFKEYIERVYHLKENNPEGSPLATGGKLCMNALYGKLIEVLREKNITLDEFNSTVVWIPAEDEKREFFANCYYETFINAISSDNLEDALVAVIEESNGVYEANEQAGEDKIELIQQTIANLSLNIKKFSYRAIPAAATMITGIARARLRAVIKGLSAIYWDTDSAFIPGLVPDAVEDKLDTLNAWLPDTCDKIHHGKSIGNLACEIEHASGALGGTKRYYLEGKVSGNSKMKKATHGVPATPAFKDKSQTNKELKRIITQFATLKPVSYKTRPKPAKIKQAEIEAVGRFTQYEYDGAKGRLDARLNWSWNGAYYEGRYKEFSQILFENSLK